MSTKHKGIRKRIVIALLIITLSFLYQVHFSSNVNYYSIAHAVGILGSIIGLLVIFGPMLLRIDQKRPNSFFLSPKKSILNFLSGLGIMAIMVSIGFLILLFGKHLSIEWLKIRINKNPKVTSAKVIGFEQKTEISRYNRTHQKFMQIEFADNGIKRKEFILIEKKAHFKIDDTIEIAYNSEAPNLVYFSDKSEK